MENLKIALLQLLPGKTKDENQEKGIAACRIAKEQGADIALFPEMWNNGYTVAGSPEELAKQALDPCDSFVSTFACLAEELQMAIGITFLEKYDPAPRNVLYVFDRCGKRVLTYAKVHTCDFENEKYLTPGDRFPVAELKTENGSIRIGAMICYDREFPESARILMLNGAELILTPNACPMEINRISQLRARAFENMVSIATCNYPIGQPDCNGHSTVFDGIVYPPDGGEGRDTLLLDAGKEEGIYTAVIHLDQLRQYRSKEIHGNAYRRPEMYGEILSQEVFPPFIRIRRT